VTARRPRQGDAAGAGWLATLVGAVLLLAAGFAVGVLAGTVWEAPDLVMDHLAGRTTELPLAREIPAQPGEPAKAPEREPPARPLGARAGPPETPGAEAPAEGTPAPAPAPRPEPKEPRSEPKAPRPEPKAPRSEARTTRPEPATRAGFAIQVGAFGDADAAERLARTLRARGFSAHVLGGEGAGASSFRVRVGPVASREEASRLARKLESELRLPTWILSPDSR
jgi:cell division septation protein DedD